jgi:putative peptidoglycan lipid II flippase
MSFARSLFTVSSLTVLSRLAGFVRDTLIAMFLGAGPIADAFFVAQRLPNLFRSLFAEGAFSAAFVPLYSAEQERNGTKAALQFAGQAMALLLTVLVPFSILIMVFMPLVMRVLAPGFETSPEKFAIAVKYSTITFPYLALVSVTALQTGVLNAHGRFGPGAAAPIAFHIVVIAALFTARMFSLDVGYTLSWSVTLSGVVQLVWLAISCRRANVAIPLALPRWGEASQKLFHRIGPGAIGAGASQINLLVSTILASTLPTGAVSYLFYADRLNQLPLGIVGIAVATTLLPLLSRHVEAGQDDAVKHYISRAMEFCLVLGLPAMIGLVLAAGPIVQTLFEHGKFAHADTIATAQTLAAYSLGVPAFLLVKVYSAAFFARHDTKTPVKIAILAMVTNVAFCLLLLGPMHYVGIALANSIATWANAIFLLNRLKRKTGSVGDERFFWRLPRLLLCAACMGLVTWLFLILSQNWFETHRLWHEIGALTLVIGASTLVYALLLELTGAMRIEDALAILKRDSKMKPSTEE